jgi:hypothetical protein
MEISRGVVNFLPVDMINEGIELVARFANWPKLL